MNNPAPDPLPPAPLTMPDAPPQGLTPPVPPARPPALVGPGGRALTALLVDDNPINLMVGAALLESLGLKVKLAHDGAEAVAQVAAQPFDLVLMDVHMPRLDGVGATRAIRALPAGAQVPVIAMTANALDISRDACLAAGMNDFLTKPVDLWHLAHTLARWAPR